MKILVTGGTGRIGANLVKRLLDRDTTSAVLFIPVTQVVRTNLIVMIVSKRLLETCETWTM